MNPLTLPLRFTARVISGRSRGRTLGVPTLNLDLRDVQPDLQDGLYAGRAIVEETEYQATIHWGPRPTFGDTRTFEVHVIDADIPAPSQTVTVEIVQFLRAIEKFPSAEALTKQMHEDIAKSRDILGS